MGAKISRLSLVLSFLAAMATAASAEILWGANGHPFYAYPGIPVARQLDFLADLGMKSYRVNISGTDKADELAALIEEAKKRDIQILPVVTPGNVDLLKDDPDTLYEKAFDLAVSLVSRFKDDIRIWELGNEMENFAIIQPCEKRDDGRIYPCEYGPAGGVDPLDYYGPRWKKVSAVLKGLSDGTISVDPTILKAMGTAGWGHVGAFQRMEDDGIRWDISVWHAYGEDPAWAFDILSAYDRPIWLTELNNPYGSKRGEERQAKGLERMMARLRKLSQTYDLEAAHIYELMDEPYWQPDFEAYMGLVRVKSTDDGGWEVDEPKPAYVTVKEIIRGPSSLSIPSRNCDLAHVAEAGQSVAARQVGYSFCLVLGREADGAGLESWTQRLASGEIGMFDLLMEMIGSEEFADRYATFGLPNGAYINLLFHLLLNREADGYGLSSYQKELAEGTTDRIHVALGLISSSEFKDKHPILFEKREAGFRSPMSANDG